MARITNTTLRINPATKVVSFSEEAYSHITLLALLTGVRDEEGDVWENKYKLTNPDHLRIINALYTEMHGHGMYDIGNWPVACQELIDLKVLINAQDALKNLDLCILETTGLIN